MTDIPISLTFNPSPCEFVPLIHPQDKGIGEGKRLEVHGRKLLFEVCVTNGSEGIWKGLHVGTIPTAGESIV